MPKPTNLALTLLLVLAALAVLPGPSRPALARDEGKVAVRVLRKALKSDDANARIAALREIERASRRLEKARRRSAAVAIKKRLVEERDAEVRRWMIRALASLGGATGWLPVLLATLHPKDEIVAAEARQAVLWGGGDYLEVIGRLLREDKDPTFRARLLLLLGDRRKTDVVSLLLDRLGEKIHPRVRSAAAEALEAITGEAFGYDEAAWRAWWETSEADARRAPPFPAPGDDTHTVTEERRSAIPEPEPHVGKNLHPYFYSLPLTSKDVVFVIDISGSVGSGGVGRGKRELIEAVELLGSDVHISALFFDEQVRMWKPEMVPATPENKAELALFLRAIKPGKRTDVFTPLNAGLQIVRRRVLEKARAGEPIREAVTMIIVSDGKETSAATPAYIVEDKLARLDREHAVVHVVALGKGSRLLMEIARRAGGHYIPAR